MRHGHQQPPWSRHRDEPGHQHEHGREQAHEPIGGDADGAGDRAPSDGGEGGVRGLAALMVPFGAAASPDLTILPVFLAATTAGVATAVGSVLVFAAATIATIVGLTLLTAHGTYQFQGDWLERWGNIITAAVLLIIGVLVLFAVI